MHITYKTLLILSIFAMTAHLNGASNQSQSEKRTLLKKFLSCGNVLNCDPQPSKIIQELGQESRHRISTEDPMTCPLAEDSFDAVCAVSSPNREPKEKHPDMLKTFHEILRPDGILILSLKKANDGSSGYSEEEVKKILADAGFEILECSIVNGSEPDEKLIEVLSKKTTPPRS